jgi:hypothetical protein
VDNSSAYNVGGVTLDQGTVVCDWGFYSPQGISFNINCNGTARGASGWSNVQRCLPAFEIKLVFTSPYLFTESTILGAVASLLPLSFTGTSDSVVTASVATISNFISSSSSTTYDEITVTGWLFYELSTFRDGNYSYARSGSFKAEVQTVINVLDPAVVYTMTVSKLNEPSLSGAYTYMMTTSVLAALSYTLLLI